MSVRDFELGIDHEIEAIAPIREGRAAIIRAAIDERERLRIGRFHRQGPAMRDPIGDGILVLLRRSLIKA